MSVGRPTEWRTASDLSIEGPAVLGGGGERRKVVFGSQCQHALTAIILLIRSFVRLVITWYDGILIRNLRDNQINQNENFSLHQ